MSLKLCFGFLFVIAVSTAAAEESACNWLQSCKCGTQDDPDKFPHGSYAVCSDQSAFPHFPNSIGGIIKPTFGHLKIGGSFSLIPSNSFSDFKFAGTPLVVIEGNGQDLLIEASAFNNKFYSVTLAKFGDVTIKSNAFFNTSMSILEFSSIRSITFEPKSLQNLRAEVYSFVDVERSNVNPQLMDDVQFDMEHGCSVKMVGCHLTAFPNFGKMTRYINSIDVSGNKFTNLTGLALYATTLKEFKCNKCDLTTIPQQLEKASQLDRLELNSNSIEEITKGLFDKLAMLTTVSLRDNKIKKIRSGDFNGAGKASNGVHLFINNVDFEENALAGAKWISLDMSSSGDAFVELDLSRIADNALSYHQIGLNNSPHLKRVYLSDESKHPTLLTLDLSTTALEGLDESVLKLFSDKDPTNNEIKLRAVKTFDCSKDLAWMARCVLCPSKDVKRKCNAQLTMDDATRCSGDGNTSLKEHLKAKYSQICTS